METPFLLCDAVQQLCFVFHFCNVDIVLLDLTVKSGDFHTGREDRELRVVAQLGD